MFEWHEYLEFADALYNGEQGAFGQELRHRNSVSRAYYGAYCMARNFCHRKKIFYPKGAVEDHGDLIDTCKKHANYDLKEVGKSLEWLRWRRNDCDYLNDLNDSRLIKKLEDTADQALERAFEISNELLLKADKDIS